MTASTGARLAIVARLVDNAGVPVTGAVVTFTPSNPAVTWVEPAVVAAAGSPGTYYRTMIAPAATGSTTVSVSATWCASTVALSTTPSITFAAPVVATGFAGAAFQGVGGCSPVGGHIRARVIEAETGNPISGASVMVGQTAGTPFVASASALFPSPTAAGSNTATTNAAGYVEFLDFGPSGGAHGPQIVTAGVTNRAYVTMYNWNGADMVIALPLRRPTRTLYRYTNGTAAPLPAASSCNYLRLGFAVQDFDLRAAATFQIGNLFGPNKCPSVGGSPASVPENTYLPNQRFGPLCLASTAGSNWSASFESGQRYLGLPFVEVPYTVAQSGDFVAMVQRANFLALGFQSVNVTANVAGNAFNLADNYPHAITFNFSNQPPQTDVEGLSLLDFNGTDGIGQLGINGVQVHKFSDAGSSVAVRVGSHTTAPGARYLAALVATYLLPVGARTIPANLLNGSASVFIRSAAGGGQPFDSTADRSFTVNSFLGLAPVAVDAAATTFTFGDATNAGQVPQYSISTLSVRHTTWFPKVSCEATPSTRVDDYPEWIVIRPHAADSTACAALSATPPATCEAFTLPTLPAGFPYQAAATQRQSGFEGYVGSGVACTGAGQGNCAVAGEICAVPVGSALAARCMGNDGTNNFQERYYWTLEDRILGATPTAVTAGAADLTQWRPGLTQSSTNGVQWP